jgi:hypothetical protein
MPSTNKSAADASRGRGRPRNPRATRPRAKPENLNDAELIARAIAASTTADGQPITDRDFASTVLLCHPRTLRKYLDGRPLPALAREKLLTILEPGR